MLFRRAEIWDEEKQVSIVLLWNLLAFGATTTAANYKDRWQVELFLRGPVGLSGGPMGGGDSQKLLAPEGDHLLSGAQ